VAAIAPTLVTVTSNDGTRIACWRSGAGPALALVHGAVGDHTSWDVVVPGLGQYFTVYAMDRRGRGASGDGPIYALEREFEDVAAVVDGLGEPVHLLGHSYGAVCALEAALLTPHLAKLVLYEPGLAGGIFPDGFADELDGLIALGKRDEAAVTFLLTALHEPTEFAETLRADPGWPGAMAKGAYPAQGSARLAGVSV
jgi:pimeloyl-ACP methyl ester carboxylesterase